MSDELHDDRPPCSRAEIDAGQVDGARESDPVPPHLDAPRPNFRHSVYGRPTAVWAYKDRAGKLLSYIARHDPPQERKQFIPYTFYGDAAGGEWRRKGWPQPRPLFNLDKLAARPDAPALVVEGEKAAVGFDGYGGAAALLPSHVCITSAGGAEAAHTADWTPLAGRDVVIWPDADEPGAKYAKDVAQLAWKAGARSVRIVDVSALPNGFDLGDEIPPDLDIEARVQNAREYGRYLSYDRFTMDPERGLWVEIEGRNCEVETHFVCAAFEVLGRARTPAGQQWARLLRWSDEDGRVHTIAVPDADLHGDAKALAASLATQGLKVSTGKGRSHFAHYLNGLQCERRLTLVDRTGWHEIDGHRAFVMPERNIGTAADILLNSSGATPYDGRGSLTDWRNGVGRLVGGHTRLMFAVSTAFAGTLLRIIDQEGGGVHFHGDSSIGKSAAAAAAASVWGRGSSPGFMRSWRATANAIEGAAAIHNDTLLVLDEIGLVDAREAAPAAYQLAAGVGKGRLSRDGSLRPALTWCTVVLSTGEIRLADKLRENGQRAMAGQSVRLIDVPADAGRGFGVFDHPGETQNAKELADAIKLAACTHHGTAGPAFVQGILKCEIGEIQETVRTAIAKFRAEVVPDGADGQVLRAADRFALIAVAGELGCELGIVPWLRSDAYNAGASCFSAWLDRRGGMDPAEVQQAIAQVRWFIEAHGQSRFEELGAEATSARPIFNRAGFRRGSGEDEEWWFFPETFKGEVCVGHDPTQTARVLAHRGMLIPGSGGGFTNVRRVNGRPTRVYVVTANILLGEVDE